MRHGIKQAVCFVLKTVDWRFWLKTTAWSGGGPTRIIRAVKATFAAMA